MGYLHAQSESLSPHQGKTLCHLKKLSLFAQVAASQQTLHEVAQELKQKEPKTYKGYIKQLKRKAEKTKEDDEQSLLNRKVLLSKLCTTMLL